MFIDPEDLIPKPVHKETTITTSASIYIDDIKSCFNHKIDSLIDDFAEQFEDYIYDSKDRFELFEYEVKNVLNRKLNKPSTNKLDSILLYISFIGKWLQMFKTYKEGKNDSDKVMDLLNILIDDSSSTSLAQTLNNIIKELTELKNKITALG